MFEKLTPEQREEIMEELWILSDGALAQHGDTEVDCRFPNLGEVLDYFANKVERFSSRGLCMHFEIVLRNLAIRLQEPTDRELPELADRYNIWPPRH